MWQQLTDLYGRLAVMLGVQNPTWRSISEQLDKLKTDAESVKALMQQLASFKNGTGLANFNKTGDVLKLRADLKTAGVSDALLGEIFSCVGIDTFTTKGIKTQEDAWRNAYDSDGNWSGDAKTIVPTDKEGNLLLTRAQFDNWCRQQAAHDEPDGRTFYSVKKSDTDKVKLQISSKISDNSNDKLNDIISAVQNRKDSISTKVTELTAMVAAFQKTQDGMADDASKAIQKLRALLDSIQSTMK
jgi:hypothetical protein